MSAALGVSLAGSALGGMAANKLSGQAGGNGNLSSVVDLPSTISQMNAILNTAMGNAIGSSSAASNSAISQQNASLSNATNAMTGANVNANNALAGGVNQGTAQNQALQAPYNSVGLTALDSYMGTLGLATPVGGSQQLQSNLLNAGTVGSSLQNLQQAAAANGNANPYAQPGITPDQIKQYLMAHTTQSGGLFGYNGLNSTLNNGAPQWGNSNSFTTNALLLSNPGVQQDARQALMQTGTPYAAQNNAYNAVGTALSSTGSTPQSLAQAAAYNSGRTSGK